MLTEYQVKQRIEAIRTSQSAPLRKTRMFLRLGKALKTQAQTLSQESSRIAPSTDPASSAVVKRMWIRSERMLEDVRSLARRSLRRRT